MLPPTITRSLAVSHAANEAGCFDGGFVSHKLRVLHVIDSAGIYGAEKVLLSLAANCASGGHEVVIGSIVSPCDAEDALGAAAAARGLRTVRFLMRDGPNPRGLWEILQFARQQNVAVVHSHGSKANILLACMPMFGRRQALVCTLHGWTAQGGISKLRLYQVVERKLIRRFDGVVAVSTRIADEVRCDSLSDRLVTIQNGVELVPYEMFQRSLYNRRTKRADHAELLAVGRLSPEKGFDLLINAMHQLRESGVAARLRIAGDGPARRDLESQIAACSLQNEVELLGYRTELSPLYQSADFLVLSSTTEGLPIVVLEAMAHGTPVIATDVGEVAEVLDKGRCGWLVGHASANMIATSMCEAIAAGIGERETRARSARERVEAVYSVDAMTSRYLDFYVQSQSGAVRRSAGSKG